jgi:hypothetical protein
VNIRKIATVVLLSTLAFTLSACSDQGAPQMPVSSPSKSTAPAPSKAPIEALPKDKAHTEKAVLLGTTTISPGVKVRAYRVGEGELVQQQLTLNPVLKAAKAKVGSKIAVVRYTVENTSGKAVDTIYFSYNGVFVDGSGRSALSDNSYASAAMRLGFDTTPIRQFTDKKGKSGKWSLANGKSANWYTDWVIEKNGVLSQNFILGKKVISNVRLELLKNSKKQ